VVDCLPGVWKALDLIHQEGVGGTHNYRNNTKNLQQNTHPGEPSKLREGYMQRLRNAS
jgi:hypothetical protein